VFEVGFQAYNKANPLPLQFETLSFRTLDHRMVDARVPTSGAKGQDQRRGDGRRQAVLDDDACTQQRTQKGRQNAHPPPREPDTDAGTI
jgi:hypothetical protein